METFCEQFLTLAIPGFLKKYETEIKKDSIDNESGMHTVFSCVFVPMIVDAASRGDDQAEHRMLNFLEKMETCGDKAVAEVAEFTILEELCDELSDEEITRWAGEETMKAMKQIREYIPGIW